VPNPSEPDLLAQLTVAGRTDVTTEAIRLLQALRIRHTDRRPVADVAPPAGTIDAIRTTIEQEGARIHALRPEDVIDLASAAGHAQGVEIVDPQWREELSYWAGGSRDTVGVPDDVIPDQPPYTTVPGRDFGQPGTLPIGGGHDGSAVYAILYGDTDTPVAWLRGGEALSAAWLQALERDLTLLPLSAAVEVPSTRLTLRRMLSNLGEPYLVLRLGVGDPDQTATPHTPRLPTEQIVEIVGPA
jgi:hypothetical protein